jgi:TolB protein
MYVTKVFHFIVMGCLCVGIAAATASAQDVRIAPTAQLDTRIWIAVPEVAVVGGAVATVAHEMTEVLAYDLDFSCLFHVISGDALGALSAAPTDVSQVNFDAYRGLKAEFLVLGNVREEGNEYVTQFRLFDLKIKDQVIGQELRVEKRFLRLAPHRFTENIIRHLYGTPGMATSEICFSAGEPGKKEIYVADYDGANARPVTQHNSVSIKPKMSPDGKKIAYLSYKDRYSFLYVYDRDSGQSYPLSKEVGLNAAPAWSPDGRQLAMVLSKDGNTEIYLRNADGSNPRRLTKNKDGDTSPCFSPDGQRIAFVSDRGGSPQIYVMDINGGDAIRLSHQGCNSYDPAWSPDGKYIAYVVEQRGAGFQIYMMNADGSNPVRLTYGGGNNESPSWSPDSRHVIFSSTRGGKSELWSVCINTGEERKIPRISLMCEGANWGPRRD